MTDPILVVGGGISGLTVAYALQRAGIEFVLVEGRDRLGGRILSVGSDGLPSEDGFDLGPSWVWPEMQPAVLHLATELGIRLYPQHDDGDMVLERSVGTAPHRFPGFQREPRSMRLHGGTAAVVSALQTVLSGNQIRLNAKLVSLVRGEGTISARLEGPHEQAETLAASAVVLCMPPRLIEHSIRFDPPLAPHLLKRWQSTATWMAPHAKFFAVYSDPFWRKDGLSGAAQSMIGPLGEIHDATTSSGKAALFGFVGISASQRRRIGAERIIQASTEQLVRLFGRKAATPDSTLYKDWAEDKFTATENDLVASGHPLADGEPWAPRDWSPMLMLAGSETSSTNPGYLEGGVEAALRVANEIVRRRREMRRLR